MHFKIFPGYGVRADYDTYTISIFQKSLECFDVRTGWIANEHTGSQVNHLGTIPYHFFASVFDITARTPITSGIAHQLNFRIGVLGKCTFLVPHRPQAFPAGASSIAVANYDPDLDFVTHFSLLTR
jgi:hypothetical protein